MVTVAADAIVGLAVLSTAWGREADEPHRSPRIHHAGTVRGIDAGHLHHLGLRRDHRRDPMAYKPMQEIIECVEPTVIIQKII